MKRVTIFQESGIVLWYYPDEKILHHELEKYPGAGTLEAALEKGLETIVNEGACKWLSDDRRGGALPKSHHDWATHIWGPKAAAAGWKYWALLPPTEALGSANMARVVKIYAGFGVTAETFQLVRPAMGWLKNCT